MRDPRHKSGSRHLPPNSQIMGGHAGEALMEKRKRRTEFVYSTTSTKKQMYILFICFKDD